MGKFSKALFIFRRDYRLFDNTGWIAAAKASEKIIPAFIFTPEQIDDSKNSYKNHNCVQFMIESLKDLDQQLSGNLNLFYGDNAEVVSHMIDEFGVEAVYVNADYTPYSKKRDREIEGICKKNSVPFVSSHDMCLVDPGKIALKEGTKFEPSFFNKVMELRKTKSRPAPEVPSEKISKSKYSIDWKRTMEFYDPNDKIELKGGRSIALEIIENVKTDMFQKQYGCVPTAFREGTFPKMKTTELAAYLRFGCVSSREVVEEWEKLKKRMLITQTIRRDYWVHMFHNFPHQMGIGEPGKCLKLKFEDIQWNERQNELFAAFEDARTGFPFIDAMVTELKTRGDVRHWARLCLANFLTKILHVDWRKGEKFFALHLIDYDPIVNNGNWQYCGGTGTGIAHRPDIYNPWNQSKKFDKSGEYIQKWLPFLKKVGAAHLHSWDDKHKLYNLDKLDYVKPVVDYAKARNYALTMFKV